MTRKKLLVLLGSACLALTLIVLPSVAGCAPAAPEIVDIELLGTGKGTSSFFAAVAAAETVSKHVPWIRIAVTETIGSGANIIQGAEKAEKDPNIILIQCSNPPYCDAIRGDSPFEKKYTNLRYMCAYNRSQHYWITLDPNIKSVQDFVGKRISIPPPLHGAGPMSEYLLQEYGLMDKAKVERIGFSDAATNLKDGLLDVIVGAATWTGVKSVPLPPFKDIIETKPEEVHFISDDPAIIEKEGKARGIAQMVSEIPAGKLGAMQTEPLVGWFITSPAHACFAGADEDLIYEITKTIIENYQELGPYHPTLTDLSPDRMVAWLPIASEGEVHPGALRYYKEVGLWKPPWE